MTRDRENLPGEGHTGVHLIGGPRDAKTALSMYGSGVEIPAAEGSLAKALIEATDMPELIPSLNSIVDGTKDASRRRNFLVKQATSGSTEYFLDTVGLSLALWGATKRDTGNPKSHQEARNIIGFLREYMATVRRESTNFVMDFEKPRMKRSLKLVQAAIREVIETVPKQELESVGEIDKVVKVFLSDVNSSLLVSFSIPPELSPQELKRLAEVSEKQEDLTQQEFDLVVKAHENLDRKAQEQSTKVQAKAFEKLDDEGMAHTLGMIKTSLFSSDPAVRNRASKLLAGVSLDNLAFQNNGEFMANRFTWQARLRDVVTEIASGDEASEDPGLNIPASAVLKEAVVGLIDALSDSDLEITYVNMCADLKTIASRLRGETMSVEENYDEMAKNVGRAVAFKDAVLYGQSKEAAFDRLTRIAREVNENSIDKETLLDMFSTRRPLGFFLDHLSSNWQDLRRITREEIWPGFIEKRQAKLWPSERELDILRFSRFHPAAALGFSTINFYTKGYEAPEVGFEFHFNDTDRVLKGGLSREGHLATTVELEDRPDVQALLENFAVGSFEELVTIASKRITVRQEREIKVKKEQSAQVSQRAVGRGRLLPRREVTYVDFSDDHEPVVRETEDVIKAAKEREGMPKHISQKVVPLAYSQRYRYVRDELIAARANRAPEADIKRLEGQLIDELSRIPNPSSGKIDNLPPQYQLERTEDGKYLDTWRREHFRPRLEEGQEAYLPVVFQKMYKAAPITLTEHMSTWFTQEPANS